MSLKLWKAAPGLMSVISAPLLFGAAHAQSALLHPPVSTTALRQINALEADADARTPAQQKISSQLIYALRQTTGRQAALGLPLLRTRVATDSVGLTLVDISANVSPDLLRAIVRAGGNVVSASEPFGTIRAHVPLALVENLAARTDVRFVRPAALAHLQNPASLRRPAHLNVLTPLALQGLKTRLRAFVGGPIANTGSVNSEGDVAHQADKARSTYHIDGTGIKVGVLSDSLDDSNGSYASALASKDVSTVTVIKDANGVPQDGGQGSAEGLAMLEIVHDLAPGAQLYFATAFNGEGSFADNIVALQKAGCNVIIDDVSYGDESPFQDGVIAQAVDTVTKAGALYFSSAGNAGSLDSNLSSVWEGDFKDSGQTRSSGKVHAFGTLAYNTASVPYESQIYAVLFWSDPLGKSANDYDLFVLSEDGSTVVASSTDRQTGAQDPIEYALVSDGERLVVVQHSGSTRFLHMELFTDADATLEVGTTGNTHGHNSAVDAFCVAATPAGLGSDDPRGPYPNPFDSSDTTEYFSSDGPRQIFYNPDGSAITSSLTHTGGKILNKPEFTAADGVSTTLPSYSGLNPFYGTSAAAPHAGAIAALMLSYNKTLTLAQVRSILQGSATDIMASGYDRDSGAGILNALKALQNTPAPGGSVSLSSVVLTPTSVPAGQTSTGKITLAAAAPTGGATITLKSSDTSSATVPSSVTIDAGNKSKSFTVTTLNVTTTKTVTITATVGSSVKTATLTVTPTGVTVSSLTLSPTSVVGGSATSTGTITLTGPAPSGGLAVTQTSSDTSAATLAGTLNIPAGATSAKFKITTYTVTGTKNVTITSTANGTSKTATLTVTGTAPAPITVASLTLSPTSVKGGAATSTGTVTLTGPAPSGGLAVTQTSSDTSAATLAGTLNIPAGATSAKFKITTYTVTGTKNVTITSTANGTSKTATLAVTP